ncbi:MAG: histidine--tRNA ligase [Deltaproteobacteria bacterium]|jgi:histidyl-tRNA synthetase|nr:histidine--tRNA ligase [Deltaproteobacteria bacterium]
MSALTAVRGFKDILPEEIGPWSLIEGKARDLAGRFGFKEIRVPVLERTELFARGIGDATDIVEKEMYTLEDRGGDRITLRPEATAGIARAVIEHSLLASARTSRLFSIGPMFRYERPQKGRLRQFHQLDCEIFGDPGPWADAEVISLLWSLLSELVIPGLTLAVNTLGCPRCRPGYREKLVRFLSGEKDRLCPDCLRRLDRNPMRVLDCKNPGCRELALAAPRISDSVCPECGEHFDGVLKALSSLGLSPELDPLMVRGLDYYARTAFEVLSGGLGAQNAVAGGGRYDGLLAALGGPDLPGIGFAAGLERLTLLLPPQSPAPGPDYYLAPLCPEALEPLFRLAGDLRSRGLSVVADWESGSLKSRLKKADRSAARRIVMVGGDELKGGYALVRDMTTKEQARASLEDLKPLAGPDGTVEGPVPATPGPPNPASDGTQNDDRDHLAAPVL